MTSFDIWNAVRLPVTAQKETTLQAERDTPHAPKHVHVDSGGASTRVNAGGGKGGENRPRTSPHVFASSPPLTPQDARRTVRMRAFISYSHRDEESLRRLKTHLAVLEREGNIEAWYDRKILAGGNIDSEIDERLEACELFLALISPDFLASDYCYSREMGLALERHRSGQAHVVPIIIEPCDWKSTPLRQLKAIPKDGEPIAKWENANEAYLDVVNELRRITTRRNTRHGLDAVVAEAIGRQFGQIHQRNMPRAAGTTRIQRMDPRGREQQASEAEPQVPAQAMGRPSAGGKYRIKQDFDNIHRAEFREATYATIREHFEREIAELNSLGSIRARLTARSATSFSCTVVVTAHPILVAA